MKRRVFYKSSILAFVFILLAVSGLAVAAAELEVKDLTPWQGENEAFGVLFQVKAADQFFVEVAKYADGYTPEMARKFYEEMYRMKFNKLSIPDGRTAIFDDKITGKYNYLGKLVTTWGEYNLTWYIFKTNSDEAINAGFKYLLMMPYHGHGDGMAHCHMRYGNEDFDYLTTDPSITNWWPTLFQAAEVNKEEAVKAMQQDAKMYSSMLPPLK